MTKAKNTKRALLASVLSLLVCVSMLVGSTFAWFTDTASTGVNTIQAGKLDVSLMMKADDPTTDVVEEWSNAEGQTLNFQPKDGRTTILWEPGCTYELPALKIVNNGDLAFKYSMLITGVQGNLELADVLDVYIKIGDGEWNKNVGTLAQLMTDPDGAAYGILLPAGERIDSTTPEAEQKITESGETASYTIALHMQETAGNEYQAMALSDMAFTVYASQYTYEYDSNDNKYDADAPIIRYENVLSNSEVAELAGFEVKNIEDAYISGLVPNPNIEGYEDYDFGYPTTINAPDDWRGQGTASHFTNVKIDVDTEGYLPSAPVSPAILAANNSTFTDCIVKDANYVGDEEGITPMAMFVLQNQTTKLIGGEYESIAVQGNAALIVDGATVDYIATAARNNTYTAVKDKVYGLGGGLFVESGSYIKKIEASMSKDFVSPAAQQLLKIVIKAGATVDEIDLTAFDVSLANFSNCHLVIEEGATVGKIVVGNTTYTLTEWLTSGYNR